MAIALGFEAVKAGKSVFFATLAELVDSMRKAEREGKLRERVKFLSRYSLLIVDEIGYLPVGSGGGNLFFQLVNACYERCAMVMTATAGSVSGRRYLATPSWQLPCSIGCCITASSCRSRAIPTDCENTPR